MKRLLGVLALLLLTLPVNAIEETAQIPTHVVMFSLDGTRPDALQQAGTPHIDALIERGVVDWQAQTIVPSLTLQAHTSMLTGLEVREHGVDWNEFRSEPQPLTTWLNVAAAAGFQASIVTGTNKLAQLRYPDEVGYVFNPRGDFYVLDDALVRFDEGDNALLIHFPNPDFFGHTTFWMSEEYIQALEDADRLIGRLLDKLDAMGILEETLLVISSDHGGHDQTHGTTKPVDMTIPFIIAGPGIRQGIELDNQVSITQIAATILKALNLEIPESMNAPVADVFVGAGS